MIACWKKYLFKKDSPPRKIGESTKKKKKIKNELIDIDPSIQKDGWPTWGQSSRAESFFFPFYNLIGPPPLESTKQTTDCEPRRGWKKKEKVEGVLFERARPDR